ncbi:chloride channel protein [Tardiphaga alba]|uniref:Chloride channel protein n=1 Tax=Tardiphaga alba TaxID=340268 RepID=A0ABX8AC75_9BRAD|nr:chloride channel protein [Tardiphaga alba]QUS41307.1 chloride channel protein [Tardiphaga alba]
MKTRRYLAHFGLRSRLARKRWTRHMLFLAGGICVGLAAIAMAWLADHAQHLFGALLARWPYAGLLVTPVGFGICMWLAIAVFPNAQGSGIPQVIAALRLPNERRGPLVSLRVALGKVVVMSLGLLFGASTGREGPTVQVGGAIMAALGRFAPYRQPGFLLAGSAAGVAAAFNTPLAGIVFAIEELSRSFEMRSLSLVIGAIVAAGLTSLALLGEYHYFGSPSAVLPLGEAWLVVPVCAILCGVLGGIFSRILMRFALGLPGRFGHVIKRNPVIFAGGCGLGVALCGLASGIHVYGTGYEQARAIIDDGPTAVAHGFGAWKYAATMLSAISGIPGGIFAPSLAIGAGIASNLAALLPPVPLDALVLIGMVSYLTGVVRAPITAFVITSEMTNNHAMVIPLMAAALIANGASQLVLSEGLYHALARITLARFAADAPKPT